MRNKKNYVVSTRNVAYARLRWPAECSRSLLLKLRELTTTFSISAERGDVCLIDGGWYITNAGLLGIAHRRRCQGIRAQLITSLSDPSRNRWIFKATVFKSRRSKGFVGFGDADPSNVSPVVHGAEMRIAETRAVNRALRKAYGIGLCSVEELGWTPRGSTVLKSNRNGSSPAGVNDNGHGAPPRLRDRLCLLIREHHLDPTLVKAYAADYCGTPAIHNASREQVEAFINHLTERATNDRGALVCHLNSFSKAQEVSS